MNRVIGAVALVGVLLLFDAVPATAHSVVQNHHNYADSHRLSHRGRHMPGWARRDYRFHRWYRRSALQSNYYLNWRQLHDIYLWERRYAGTRFYQPGHYNQHRQFAWYRSYWHKQHDRRARDKRGRRKRH